MSLIHPIQAPQRLLGTRGRPPLTLSAPTGWRASLCGSSRRTFSPAMRLAALLLCALWAAASAENAEDYELMYVNLDKEIDNGLQPTADPAPCNPACRQELSRWDKLFVMLEDSQMRQSMLLQATDNVLHGELQRLRAELNRLAGSLARPCVPAAPADTALAGALDELLRSSRDAGRRLARLEGAEAAQRPEPAGCAPGAVLDELRQTRAELGVLRSLAARHWLPEGCETALLFPMRSKKIFASVHPVSPMKLESFSACLWFKATDVLNKTVLFSYGTKRSPYEIQLYLSNQSIVAVVGGENRLVAETVVSPGRWTHMCSTWSSETGHLSLWVNGDLVASTAKMARGHVVPEGGLLQIGQEKNGCCVGGGFEEALAFSGRLTGFNIWDRVLSNEEIREAGGVESCHFRGNVVGWGVTEIQPHGGAQYVS